MAQDGNFDETGESIAPKEKIENTIKISESIIPQEIKIVKGPDKQQRRRTSLIFLLKKSAKAGIWVTQESLRKFMKIIYGEKDPIVNFTRNTFYDDIKSLKKLGAKIEYIQVKQDGGYVLNNPEWCGYHTTVPEEEMMALIVGVHIALNILPQSELRSKISAATNILSGGNYTDRRLDSSAVIVDKSLSLAGKEDIFMVIFTQWLKRHNVSIKYRDGQGNISERTVEPHFLAYTEDNWYLKGRDASDQPPQPGDFRSFSLRRILSAKAAAGSFERDKQEQERLNNSGNIFNFPCIKGVQLLVKEDARIKCIENLPVINETVQHDKKSSIVDIAPIQEYHVTKFIMESFGKASVIEPPDLREKIRKQAKAIMEANSYKK